MVRIDELRAGLRPSISEREFAQLRGCTVATPQKERVTGKGIPFLKDPMTGRISYAAADVLAFFDRPRRCTSTSEYDTTKQLVRLEKARESKNRQKKGSTTTDPLSS